VRDALAIIERQPPAFAVLDVNLAGETSFPIAEKLKQANAPFVFATGYGDNRVLPKEFTGAKIVSKPYEDANVAAALKVVLN
jgi:DNA-binding response OmpR family regulator